MKGRYLVALFVALCGCDKSEAEREPADGEPGERSESAELDKFSFFVTSLQSLRELSGSQSGFGGDLRFGETGKGAGLRGADKLCATIADLSMKGASAKEWRAFLSTSTVDARERVGEGPWYDRKGRLLAQDLDALLKERPEGADPEIINDLPNEFGAPNHDPDGTGNVDNHDMLTGSNAMGRLFCASDPANCTCDDWTSAEPTGRPRVGHSWPRSGTPIDFAGGGLGGLDLGGLLDGGVFDPATLFGDGGLGRGFPEGGFLGGGFPGFIGGGGGFPALGEGGLSFPGLGGGFGDGSMDNWMSALDEAGCAPGVSLIEMGPPMANNPTVGSGGGYGGFYCFALEP
jgi:hypothetical protein